jgi:hypothetical protein
VPPRHRRLEKLHSSVEEEKRVDKPLKSGRPKALPGSVMCRIGMRGALMVDAIAVRSCLFSLRSIRLDRREKLIGDRQKNLAGS